MKIKNGDKNKKQDISITPFLQRMEYPAFTI